MDWYYIDSSQPEGKRRNGPWSLRQMLGFAEQGAFASETLVWRDGFESWKPWYTVEPELKSDAQVEIIKQVIEEKVLPNITASKVNYAGFWIRFCAFAIDSAVLQFIFILLTPIHFFFGVLPASEITPLTSLADLVPTMLFLSCLAFFYHSFFVKNFSGTLGKIILGLAVVCHDGKPMTWNCAFLRSFGACFLSSFFALGFLLVAFDIEKRSLHDIMANTRVLKLQRAS
jgi:uncharacterized RDD family membrane protein YckC